MRWRKTVADISIGAPMTLVPGGFGKDVHMDKLVVSRI